MELLMFLLMITGAASVALFAYRAHQATSEHHRRLWHGWHLAAGRVGLELTFERATSSGPPVLRARRRGLEVRLEELPQTAQGGTRITASALGAGAEGLTVRPRRLDTRWTKHLMGEGVEIGDPFFDQSFVVEGNPLLAVALLDAVSRLRLAELLSGKLPGTAEKPVALKAALTSGVLTVEVPHPRDIAADRLGELMTTVLGPVLDLAGRLVEPKDLAGRLAANLGSGRRRNESEAGVRLRTLRLLLGNFRDHAETAPVLAKLIEDENPAVRLEVAVARGRVNEAKLLSALESSDEETVRIAARALGGLGSAVAVPALRALEARAEGETARAASQAVAEIQSRLEGAERGQLSLADAEVGALSLAEETEPGRLSLAKEEA